MPFLGWMVRVNGLHCPLEDLPRHLVDAVKMLQSMGG